MIWSLLTLHATMLHVFSDHSPLLNLNLFLNMFKGRRPGRRPKSVHDWEVPCKATCDAVDVVSWFEGNDKVIYKAIYLSDSREGRTSLVLPYQAYYQLGLHSYVLFPG